MPTNLNPEIYEEQHSFFNEHNKYKRKCEHLDRRFGAGWVTCLHKDNPTGVRVCSHEHCPKKRREVYPHNNH